MIHAPGVHKTDVIATPLNTPRPGSWRYQAYCSCGWLGQDWITAEEARADADGHIIYTEEGNR